MAIHYFNQRKRSALSTGLLLYLIYTTDLPPTNNTTIATFADDTALLAANNDPVVA
jgi:hypothetical protein